MGNSFYIHDFDELFTEVFRQVSPSGETGSKMMCIFQDFEPYIVPTSKERGLAAGLALWGLLLLELHQRLFNSKALLTISGPPVGQQERGGSLDRGEQWVFIKMQLTENAILAQILPLHLGNSLGLVWDQSRKDEKPRGRWLLAISHFWSLNYTIYTVNNVPCGKAHESQIAWVKPLFLCFLAVVTLGKSLV